MNLFVFLGRGDVVGVVAVDGASALCTYCGDVRCSVWVSSQWWREKPWSQNGFKNHKRRGFGTPVGDVVEPLDISMGTLSL